MKNKLPRPTKGQLPDPTYSRMKFASCTDRADSGGGVGVKKSPRLAGPRAIHNKNFNSYLPHYTASQTL